MGLLKTGRKRVNDYIRLRIERMIINYLKKVPKFIKKKIIDKDMCECVKKLTSDLVDSFWPDIEEEILFQFRLALNKPVLVYEQPPPKRFCLIRPCCCLRACFRHSYMPVDMSIWKRIKTFWFWVLMGIQAFPFYAVQPVFKLVVWLMLDKQDEYQLVKFILDFKTLQFFTLGCLGGIINYFSYYSCVVIEGGENKSGDEVHDCANRSPSWMILFYIECAGFLLQVILVWISYFLLPCAAQKGMPDFKLKSKHVKKIEEKKQGGCCVGLRGGRLTWFMIWELVISIISVIIFGLLLFFLKQKNATDMLATVNLLKVIYGLLSFPFMIFAIPILAEIVTKTRPTRYDKYGRCVPDIPSIYERREKLKKAQKEENEKKLKRSEMKAKNYNKFDKEEDLEDLIVGDAQLIDDELVEFPTEIGVLGVIEEEEENLQEKGTKKRL